MITYSKRFYDVQLLVRLYGSAFPRCIIFATVSVSITILLYFTVGQQYFVDSWRHPVRYFDVLYVLIHFKPLNTAQKMLSASFIYHHRLTLSI